MKAAILALVVLAFSMTLLAPQALAQTTVQVAFLTPITGEHLADSGRDAQRTADLALADFNRYLADNDRDWRLDLVTKDTMADPETTQRAVAEAKAAGIDIVIGPLTSAGVHAIKDYTRDNDMFVLSPTSGASSLAITDHIYRMVPSIGATTEAQARLMTGDGIRAVTIIQLDDAWGDSYTAGLLDGFAGLPVEVLKYRAGVTDAEIRELLLEVEESVRAHARDHTSTGTAVALLAFDESHRFLAAANESDILRSVAWYASSANVGSGLIPDDPEALAFANSVSFRGISVTVEQQHGNERKERIDAAFGAAAPSPFVYPVYDSVWLMGLVLDETAGQDATRAAVMSSIEPVARGYTDAAFNSGGLEFDQYGDLVHGTYIVSGFTGSDTAWRTLAVLDLSPATMACR